MVKIIQKENQVLRKKSEEVPVKEITSPKFKKIVENMIEALDSQNDGVAIAAPQIGELWRIFVVSGKVKTLSELEKKGEFGSVDFKELSKEHPDLIFFNPKIVKFSKEKEMLEEGCLSVRWLYGKVERAKKATIEAYDENARFIKKGASGLLAQIFQHETEHLDGILFTDKAKDLEELKPDNV